jgi:hypothetical protein
MTSVQNIACMCVTYRWINDDWQLASAVMQTREVGVMQAREEAKSTLVKILVCDWLMQLLSETFLRAKFPPPSTTMVPTSTWLCSCWIHGLISVVLRTCCN